MSTHFRGNRRYLYEFGDLFLVRCPRCERCARVLPMRSESWPPHPSVSPYYRATFAPRRLTCEYCGYSKEWRGKKISMDGPRDWYFGCALWLQTGCCGDTLWAVNPAHLRFLEEFVRAGIRETHWNATLAARLPEWMKLGKNREDVLKCIERLRALLA